MKFPSLFLNLDNYHQSSINDPSLQKWVWNLQSPPNGDNDVSSKIAQLDSSKNHFKHFVEATYSKSHWDNDLGIWLLKPKTSKMSNDQYVNLEMKYNETALHDFVQKLVSGEHKILNSFDSMTELMNSSAGLSLICGLIISANKLGIADNAQEIEKLFVFLLQSYSNISWHGFACIGLSGISAAMMMFGPLVQSLLNK